MTMNDRILDLIERDLNIQLESRGVNLFDSGLIDSAMFVDLLMLLETEFEIEVSLEELDPKNFATVDLISDFVESKAAKVNLSLG